MNIPFLLTEEHIHIIGGGIFYSPSLFHIPLCENEFRVNSGLRTLLIHLNANANISDLEDFKSSISELNYIMPNSSLYGHIDLEKYVEYDISVSIGMLYNDIHNSDIHITKYVNDSNDEYINCNITTQLTKYNFKEIIRNLAISNILK